MAGKTNALDTELETELDSADETQVDTETTDETGAQLDGGVSTTEPGTAPEGAAADGDDAGPKSLAEALNAGIESVAKKGEKKPDGAAGDKDGKEKDAEGKDGKTKDAADGEKPKEGEKPKDGEKQTDHVNDPIDARLAPRTQERIRSLADEVKTLRTVGGNNEAMVGAIMNSGATPDEFGALVAYMHWTHSDEPAQLEQAYKLLQSELQGVALRLGRALPEVDWLAGHADLIDGVKNGLVTRDLAVEMAMTRAQTKRTTDQKAAVTAKKTATETETAQAAQDVKTAQDELDTLGDELTRDDPQYAAKYKLIVPKLKEEFKTLPAKQWKGRFLELYARTVIKAAPVAPKIVPPKNQPLRPSAPSGGQQKAPGSAFDALSSAIDGMRG